MVFTKGPWEFNEEKIIVQQIMLENVDVLCSKNELRPLPHTIHSITNSEWT